MVRHRDRCSTWDVISFLSIRTNILFSPHSIKRGATRRPTLHRPPVDVAQHDDKEPARERGGSKQAVEQETRKPLLCLLQRLQAHHKVQKVRPP